MRTHISRLLVLIFLISPLPALAQSVFPGYENNEGALQQFIGDLLRYSRNGDEKKFDALLETLTIPDHERWFAEVFGSEEAPRLIEYYRNSRKGLLERYRRTFTEIARMRDPQITTLWYSPSESHAGRAVFWNAVAAAAKTKANLYSASYQKDKDSWALGYFFHVDGGFRIVDESVMSALSTTPPLRVRVGGNVQQSKLIHQPRPAYPEAAKAQLIQGVVKLQLIVARNGTVKQLEVVSGDPILADAAMEAVKQWRYQPTLLNGVPIEVVTTVEVDFSFRR